MDYILKHYASEYYDPEKAHQYYEEHKQLKGRRSTAQLDDEGKEIWAYTKESIKNKKKRRDSSCNRYKECHPRTAQSGSKGSQRAYKSAIKTA